LDTALYILRLTEDKDASPQSGKITNLSRGACFVQTGARCRTY
jgi:hypothetical protein